MLQQSPSWPKLSHKQLDVFEYSRQLMWMFRSATCICHWANGATAAAFGSEAFDNKDWAPYCNGGVQGETKVRAQLNFGQ